MAQNNDGPSVQGSDTPTTPGLTDSRQWTEEVKRRFPSFAHVDQPSPELTPEEIARRQEAARRRQAHEQFIQRKGMLREFLGTLGPRYEDCSLDSYVTTTDAQKAALEDLRDYAHDIDLEVAAGNGVLLYGPSGTGKDHLLIGLARVAIVKHGILPTWQNGLDLFGACRDAITNGDSEARTIRPMAKAKILILSDPIPPNGQLTDYQQAMLFRIIDERYRYRRPTWATMNLSSRDEADSRLGAALVDRLRDGATAIHCNWPSYRRPRTRKTQ